MDDKGKDHPNPERPPKSNRPSNYSPITRLSYDVKNPNCTG